MFDSSFFDSLPFLIWVQIGKMLDKKSLLKFGMTNKYAVNMTKIIMLIKLRGTVWFHLLDTFTPFGIKDTCSFQTQMVYMLDHLLDEEILKTGTDRFPHYQLLGCVADIDSPSDKILHIYHPLLPNKSPDKSPKESSDELSDKLKEKMYRKNIENMYKLIVYHHIQEFYPYLLFYHRAIRREYCFI